MIKYYQRLINSFSPWQIALLAACGYGLWAGWVNNEYGGDIALKTALIQGTYAFLSTSVITLIATKLLRYLSFSDASRWVSLIVSWLVMLAIPILLHTWQDTPDLFEAITPGVLIGSIYLWTYCHNKTPE